MSPSGLCARTYPSQRLPHRHEYHSPLSPAQPARLHPIRQLLRPVCSPPLLFQCHSKGAPLNRPEATIPATRPESVGENVVVEQLTIAELQRLCSLQSPAPQQANTGFAIPHSAGNVLDTISLPRPKRQVQNVLRTQRVSLMPLPVEH